MGLVTISTVEMYLKRISYKPNWRLSVQGEHFGEPILRIQFETVDTHTGAPTPINSARTIPMNAIKDLREFIAWLSHAIMHVEKHEHDEWLKLDNEIINDPHKEDRR